MKALVVALCLCAVPAAAQQITVAWDAPPYPAEAIISYKVYARSAFLGETTGYLWSLPVTYGETLTIAVTTLVYYDSDGDGSRESIGESVPATFTHTVPVPSAPPVSNRVEIVSRLSGKCLDIYGGFTDAGTLAVQWTCHGGANQLWQLVPRGDGAFWIVAQHSGQALDVYGAWTDDLAPVIQWPTHGGANQAWVVEPTSDGYVRLIARHSGKAMDVEGAAVHDGARAIQYTPHGGANQQWLLRPR